MTLEQHFLIRYGLHHFVSCKAQAGRFIFCIRKTQRETMIQHAQRIIQGGYGEMADIQLV